MILYLIIIFAIILLINLPPMVKKKDIKMMIIYGCFFTVAFTLSILLTLGVSITSPLVIADKLFKYIHLSY